MPTRESSPITPATLELQLPENGTLRFDEPDPATRPSFVILRLDVDGSIQEVDTRPGEVDDLDASALVFTSLFQHIRESDLLPVFRGVAELVEGKEEEVPVGFHLRTRNGLWRAAQGTMRLCRDGRTVAGLFVTLQLLASLG